MSTAVLSGSMPRGQPVSQHVCDNKELLGFFVGGWTSRSDPEAQRVQHRCLDLMKRDYLCTTIDNTDGRLCAHYPLDIIIVHGEKKTDGNRRSGSGGESDRKRSNRTTGVSAGLADVDGKANGSDVHSTVDNPERSERDGLLGYRPHGESDDSGANGMLIQPPPVVSDPVLLEEMFSGARFARTRSRFVVPVINLRGINICRSATLARQMEVQARQAQQKFNDICYGGGEASRASSNDSSFDPNGDSVAYHRSQDISLLKELGVQFICDLMVEDRKVKYGLTLTSSEKVDKLDRYKGFSVLSVPYPGCELFSELKKKDYDPEQVNYDWKSASVTASLDLPAECADELGITWASYKDWNLVQLTQNYIKLFMKILFDAQEQNEPGQLPDLNLNALGDDIRGGMLIHCISGWDRTPLFVSLLRLLLWADGELHPSLNASEVLYLTLGYDWLLFGHVLPDRLRKGEEILLFCFDVLQFLVDDEYSFGNNPIATTQLPNGARLDDDAESFLKDEALLKPAFIDVENISVPQMDTGTDDHSTNISGSLEHIAPHSEPLGAPEQEAPADSVRHSLCKETNEPSAVYLDRAANPPKSTSSPISIPQSLARTKDGSDDACGSWQMLGLSAGNMAGHSLSMSPSPLAKAKFPVGSSNRARMRSLSMSSTSSSSSDESNVGVDEDMTGYGLEEMSSFVDHFETECSEVSGPNTKNPIQNITLDLPKDFDSVSKRDAAACTDRSELKVNRAQRLLQVRGEFLKIYWECTGKSESEPHRWRSWVSGLL